MNVLIDSSNDMYILREGIKRKYLDYHLRDKDRFPLVEFNTNRRNYQPLRDAFEDEFFNLRGIDRVNNNLHIPSTNTLVLIFTDESYVPSFKILNTCRSFSNKKSDKIIREDDINGIIYDSKKTSISTIKSILISKYTLIGTFTLLCFFLFFHYNNFQNRIIIDRPYPNSTVPRNLIVEGAATNANKVWIIVRAKQSNTYWVQPPLIVNSDGIWKGQVFIGRLGNTDDVGQWFQIKAFVEPENNLYEGQQLHSWPQSKLSTDVVEVVRGLSD